MVKIPLVPAGVKGWTVVPNRAISLSHSESVRFAALDTRTIAFISSSANRTGTILPFASPFGSLGRPTFLRFCLGTIFELLNDSCSDR